jgi:hypothetical protein
MSKIKDHVPEFHVRSERRPPLFDGLITIPAPLLSKAQDFAEQNGMKLRDVFIAALAHYLGTRKGIKRS